MNKQAFLEELTRRLSGLSQSDLEERLAFYGEMIDDKVEDGLSEEEAVAGIGSVDDVVSQIMSEIPLSRLVKEKVREKKGMKAWRIVLLILGFPVWFPLLLSMAILMLSLFLVLWILVICFYIIVLALGLSALGSLPLAIYYMITGNPGGSAVSVGAGIVLAGLAILLGVGTVYMTKGVAFLCGRMMLGIKTFFIGRKE